jgi:signal transduction histidine kinase
MTTAPAEVTRAPRARRSYGFAANLAATEAALTVVEAGLMIVPAVALVGRPMRDTGAPFTIAVAVAALTVVSWVRAADLLRPVVMARDAKRAGRALPEADIAAADRAIRRTPVEVAATRGVLWALAIGALAVGLGRHGIISRPASLGLTAIGILHAFGAAAARAVLWERRLERTRRLVLPNWDALRGFARRYQRWICETAGAVLAAAHAVNAALVAVFTELTSRQSGMMLALTAAALLPVIVLWLRALHRQTRPIERYFDAAVRRALPRGPARDDPDAVAAFRAAQILPYRLAAGQAAGCAFAAVAVVVVGRRLSGFDSAAAAKILATSGLMLLAMLLYETLLLRDVLRPLLAQLGARHRLPIAQIRAPITLRAKLVSFFVSVPVLTSGLVMLFAVSPVRAPSVMGGSLALALVLALGLVVLIVRDMVTPVLALEERSDEMARGELARPVPPSGEADEIGRLAFAFEEMRRALRDRLRSTESLNIDLEREVRRRTEVLEQRNRELHDALEKLRRAQDDLVRSEKLASMGRLVAGIAHEINNPVNAVINTLGPLEEAVRAVASAPDRQAAARAADEAKEMLGVVQRGAARSKAIVQALHNYSRGDEQRPRELALARSIDDTLDLLRHGLRNVRVEKHVDPALRIAGFPGQIDQVFMNLFSNAAQAIGDRPGGGTLRIDAELRGEAVEVAVADDGPGIPPDIIGRIFDPFFTTKDVGEGSGLGLSIVHGIIDRHGGRIEVASEVGHGTTFRVILPAAPAGAPL